MSWINEKNHWVTTPAIGRRQAQTSPEVIGVYGKSERIGKLVPRYPGGVLRHRHGQLVGCQRIASDEAPYEILRKCAPSKKCPVSFVEPVDKAPSFHGPPQNCRLRAHHLAALTGVQVAFVSVRGWQGRNRLGLESEDDGENRLHGRSGQGSLKRGLDSAQFRAQARPGT